MVTYFKFIVLIFIFSFIVYSCDGDGNPLIQTITDKQGNTYTTKIMSDGNRWLTQNLNLEVENSECYNLDPLNCRESGRLYIQSAAQEACFALGDGWELPSINQWTILAAHYGGLRVGNGNGKDAQKALIEGGSSGFNAKFGGLSTGIRSGSPDFDSLNENGWYWSSTEGVGSDSHKLVTFDTLSKHMGARTLVSTIGISCRCIQELD